jgi:hypothetical protein
VIPDIARLTGHADKPRLMAGLFVLALVAKFYIHTPETPIQGSSALIFHRLSGYQSPRIGNIWKVDL